MGLLINLSIKINLKEIVGGSYFRKFYMLVLLFLLLCYWFELLKDWHLFL